MAIRGPRRTRTALARELVDLAQLGHAALEPLQATEAGRAVSFVTPDHLMVEGDPQLLRVWLDHLLGNAWKFTARQTAARIELGCDEIDGAPVYYVRDNRVGFDMALASKLFAPLRRDSHGLNAPNAPDHAYRARSGRPAYRDTTSSSRPSCRGSTSSSASCPLR